MSLDKVKHWETVYTTKQSNEMSWTQHIPKTSLGLIHGFNLPKTASIIDIGGGDSNLVDFLLAEDYSNITVLDISHTALDRAKARLKEKAGKVKWIVSDITEFEPQEDYNIWHDRATFHFLTTPGQINRYIEITRKAVKDYLAIGTFSDNGPEKCSGLEVKRYSQEQLQIRFAPAFDKINCVTEDHITPFNTVQHFLFCTFKKV